MELTELLLFIHAGFVGAGFIFMIAGVGTAMGMRSKSWWLAFHKRAGLAGSGVMLIGAGVAVSMVMISLGEHFGTAHPYLGAGSVVSAVATTAIGFLQFKVRSRSGIVRGIHRWSGRFTLLLAFIAILTGLRLVGIF